LDQHESESGLPVRVASRFEQDVAAGAEKLAETPRVPDVDPLFPPLDLHQGRETVQPPQEAAGHKGS
jgi:hypothetical protein